MSYIPRSGLMCSLYANMNVFIYTVYKLNGNFQNLLTVTLLLDEDEDGNLFERYCKGMYFEGDEIREGDEITKKEFDELLDKAYHSKGKLLGLCDYADDNRQLSDLCKELGL